MFCVMFIACTRQSNVAPNGPFCSCKSDPNGVVFYDSSYADENNVHNKCLTRQSHIDWFEDMLEWGAAKPSNGHYIWDEFYIFWNIIGKTNGTGKFHLTGSSYEYIIKYDSIRDVMLLGIRKDSFYRRLANAKDYGILAEFNRDFRKELVRLQQPYLNLHESVKLQYCNARDFSVPYTGSHTYIRDLSTSKITIKGNNNTGAPREFMVKIPDLIYPDYLIRNMTINVYQGGQPEPPLPSPLDIMGLDLHAGFDYSGWRIP